MRKFINITFSSGHIFEVPTSVVAEDRTSYYAMQDPNRTREQHAAETAIFFASDFELFDWMKNNMNWSDIHKSARLVGFRVPDFKATWDDAELQINDSQSTPDVASLGEGALSAPIELMMSQAVSEGGNCTVLAIQQPDTGAITSAVAVVVGSTEIVQGYIATIASFDDYMRAQQPAAAGH